MSSSGSSSPTVLYLAEHLSKYKLFLILIFNRVSAEKILMFANQMTLYDQKYEDGGKDSRVD